MIRTVLRKVKLSGGYGRWPAYEVAADEFGRWLFSPSGTVYWGHSAADGVVQWEVGRGPSASRGVAELWLVPPDVWWVAMWAEADGVRSIAVDVCRPAQRVGGEWRFVDLELDPYWRSDGGLGVADEDEFAQGCAAGVIPRVEAVAARAAADDVLRRMKDGVEPFGSVGWARFDSARSVGLSPLWISAKPEEVLP